MFDLSDWNLWQGDFLAQQISFGRVSLRKVFVDDVTIVAGKLLGFGD
jgi:hypothetical protein